MLLQAGLPGALQKSYGAGFNEVDFAQSEDARDIINEWVAGQTKGESQDLVPYGVLSEYTRLVFTNAIYFKGTWTRHFRKGATTDVPFHPATAIPPTCP